VPECNGQVFPALTQVFATIQQAAECSAQDSQVSVTQVECNGQGFRASAIQAECHRQQ
jgi:hypothetical protein